MPTSVFSAIPRATAVLLLTKALDVRSQPWGWAGRGGGHSVSALGVGLLLVLAVSIVFKVLFTSYFYFPCKSNPPLQLKLLYINLSLFKLLCGFSHDYTQTALEIFLDS